MNNKKLGTLSINLGISSCFIVLILITSIALSTSSYISVKKSLRQELAKQIYNAVATASLLIDGDLHSRIKDSSWTTSSEYKKLRSILVKAQEKTRDIKFLYTMNINLKDEIYFVLDSDNDIDSAAHPGDVYSDATPELLEVFKNKKNVIIENSFSTDKWGTWISGYAPIFTSSGEFAGVVGADISASDVIATENRLLFSIVLISGLVSLISILVAMYLSIRISAPLKIIEADIDNIKSLKLLNRSNNKSVFKEIESVESALSNMKTSLKSFIKYVPSDIVKSMIDHNKEAILGGEKKELTIMFSDIQNFTTLSESLLPEKLVSVMSRYFEGITRAIIDNNGTVDKYIGDAVMAFWNAPITMKNHAELAANAALSCKHFEEDFNKLIMPKGYPEFVTRFGINTGEVFVGNIGYSERFNYTTLGDNVNLSSRLESLNKIYSTRILISESTNSIIRSKFVTRLIDTVQVKGKTIGGRIYELVGKNGEVSQAILDMLETYEDGFAKYQS